jgi:hypothetical protein
MKMTFIRKHRSRFDTTARTPLPKIKFHKALNMLLRLLRVIASHILDSIGRLLKVKVLIVISIVIVLGAIISEVAKDVVVIDPFTVPADIEKYGYSPTAVANKLADNLLVIRKADSSNKSRAYALSAPDSLPSIEIPNTKVSLQFIIQYIRDFLNIETPKIGGELIKLDKKSEKLRLTIRVSSPSESASESVDGDLNKLDSMLADVASRALKYTDPYLLAC